MQHRKGFLVYYLMTYMKRVLIAFFLCFSTVSLLADSEVKESDSTYTIDPDDLVLAAIDSAIAQWRLETLNDPYLYTNYYEVDSLNENQTSPIVLNDSLFSARLAVLNQSSPVDLVYNEKVRAFINLYLNKKRTLSASVLGLAPRYYPLFEEILDLYDLPLELKHLAVVESALNPSARSWVGAKGLWQFMYATGKMYGLQVNSYYDERMNPYLATDAACRYMRDLYKLYDDWSLVLAAYNSGPGNVNRAIRRSGGQKDYWKIRPYLPRETRGYVPAFIAVNYLMNYAQEHEINPQMPALASLQVDTVHLKKAMSFSQLSRYIDISADTLALLNPQYKLKFIPESKKVKELCLPLKHLGLFLTNEGAIYADMRRIEIRDSIKGATSEESIPEVLVHHVRSGEFLGYIANKYNCSVRDLMSWNNLRTSRINPGDRLKVFSRSTAHATPKQASDSLPKPKEPLKEDGKYQFHTIRSGDTLWDIAKKYNDTSVSELKRLNSHLNFKRLKPGMQLRVKEIS